MSGDVEARLARVEHELLAAGDELQHLRRGVRRRRTRALAAFAGIALVTGWGARADTAVRAAADDDPIARMNKKIAVMTEQLQAKIDALEVRVHKLETKPDNIDNDDQKKSGGTAGNAGQAGGTEASTGQAGATNANGGQAGGTLQSISNLGQRVTALERRTSFRAPFIVTDSQGGALFTVTDNGMRGVKVFSGGVARVTLEAADEGGAVKALAPDLGVAGLAALDGKNEVWVTGPNGGTAARMTGSEQGGVVDMSSLGGGTAVLGARNGPMGLRFYAHPDDQNSAGGLGILNDGSTGMILRGPGGNKSVFLGTNDATEEGFVQVYDNGTLRAELSAGERGLVAVRNSEGKAVAYLTESKSGEGGNITLTDPAGNGIVSAGYNESEQADICLDRKNHLYCVGINLPLSMSH
jgi:hypothetical protein